MATVRIKFRSSQENTKGFCELMKNTRVVCFADSTYQIPKSALKILDREKLKYEVVKEEGMDRVYKALRDTLAAKLQ